MDRAALDAALAIGLPCGGWCPRGRAAEDGPIERRYPLVETPQENPAQRTAWNVRDSDGTLILLRGRAAGGTALTIECAQQVGKPYLVIDMRQPPDISAIISWLVAQRISALNIAGPRESESPGIEAEAVEWLRELFRRVRASNRQ